MSERTSIANIKHTDARATKWVRWIVRGIGSLVGALFLLIGAVAAISDPMPWSLEGAMLAGLVVATVLGVLIAW